MRFGKSLLTTACLCVAALSFAQQSENSLLLKPAYELTGKDRVLLDILHHDHILALQEDFSTIQEKNGRYPEVFEKAYEQYNKAVGRSQINREKHSRFVAKAAEYLATLVSNERGSSSHAFSRGSDVRAARVSTGPIVSLLIGIDYRHSEKQLQNCIHDTEHVIEQILVPKLGLKKEDMIIMNDYQYGTPYYPTRVNILEQMRNFVSLLNEVKQGYFHYSGHGSGTLDKSGDEADGKDEVMLPVDYKTAGGIIDDDVFQALISGLDHDVKLTVTMDCCHSGTILDLPYKWNPSGEYTVEQKMSETSLARLANVVMLSGCRDEQTSADGGYFTGAKSGAGAMTGAYIQTLKDYNYNLTYRQLLVGVNYTLAKNGYVQRAELSSTYLLNLDDYYMVQKADLRP